MIKSGKKLVAIVFVTVIIMALALSACQSSNDYSIKLIIEDEVEYTQQISAEVQLFKGEKSIDYINAKEEYTIEWKSGNNNVATVDNGVVTGIGLGNVSITVEFSMGDIKLAQTKSIKVIAAVSLGSMINNAKNEVNNLFLSKNIEDYNTQNYSAITKIKDDAIANLEQAESVEEIQIIKIVAINGINAVLKEIKLGEITVVNRNKITFDLDIEGVACFVSGTQYITSAVGANEINLTEMLIYNVGVKLILKKDGYNTLEKEFKYVGESVKSANELSQRLQNAIGGDVLILDDVEFVIDIDLTVPQDVTIIIPKNVKCIIISTLTNEGKIICNGEITGSVIGNPVDKGSEVIPGEDL